MRNFIIRRQFVFGFLFTSMLMYMHHHLYQHSLDNRKSFERIGKYSNHIPSNLPLRQEIPFHPFEKDRPTILVILSYQRCGSSFFGDMFSKNPDVFYMFEPLDALYSALYGTTQGWNVPSDITNYGNGSIRLLPDAETNAVSEFLRSLLLCDLDSLPTESMSHRYLFNGIYQDTNDYIKCISGETIRSVVSKCKAYSPSSYCGRRFGEKSEYRSKECQMMLSNVIYRKERPDLHPIFIKYMRCRKTLRRLIDQRCASYLSQYCNDHSLRVVKLVRGTMQSMEPLLRTIPNFRLIHLLRDPRPVVLSRMKFDTSGRGFFSIIKENGTAMSREAKLYCNAVVRDIKVRRQLEAKYPGKIYSVIYEDFVKNLRVFAKNLYKFVNAESPLEMSWWKNQIEPRTGNKSVDTTKKWKRYLTFAENKAIISNCLEFFSLIKM